MHYETRIGKSWLSWGYGKRFALGISIDKYNMSIDFLCIWISIEF